MTSEMDNSALDRLARLYFRLLDLSRDVERNRDDAAHEQNGGEIWYVFDATLLEVFINPNDPRGRAASLYSSDWDLPYVPPTEAGARAAQTALACSEYLLGGALPNQHRGTIYMSEWHRWEFQHRVEKLQEKQVSRLRTVDPKALGGRFTSVTSLLDHLARDSQAYYKRIDDKQLLADLSEFKSKEPSDDEFKAFISTRMSVDILAADKVLEPARQLSRLVTAPLRHRVSTLHLALPPDKDDLNEIARDAVLWMDRLRTECGNRSIEIVTGNNEPDNEHASSRHERALSNDAYTLALVRWAARKKAQTLDERVVLVTADHILFDTYRRWYAGLRLTDPAYSEPFALRRLIQYAPIFNLVSSGRLEGEQSRELLQDLQNVLERISAPLNLSRLSGNSVPIVERMLELTALRASESREVGDDLAYRPLLNLLQRDFATYRDELQQVITRWRDLERAALGRAGDAVQQRIRNAQTSDKLLLSLGPDATSDAYRRLLEDLVQSLVAGPQDVSLHMAREYLNSWPHEGRRFARAPIALRIVVDTPAGSIDVGERLDRRLAGDLKGEFLESEEQWQALYAQPALLFAIAAAHCVTSNDWTNAQQFVEIALSDDADPDQSHFARLHGDQLAEIRYLAALIYRFRMGEIAPPMTGESYIRMIRFYRSAMRHIDWCEAYHQGAVGGQPLRLMRARSERAALNLFYSSALNVHVRRAYASSQEGSDEATLRNIEPRWLDRKADRLALRALERAEGDLHACVMARREADVTSDAARSDFLARLVRQSTTNVCAAAVLRALWGLDFDTSPTLLRPGNVDAIIAARQRLDQFGDGVPTMVHADILGFLTLSGEESAARDLEKLPSIIPVPGDLSLDAAFIDAIRQNVARLRRVADARIRAESLYRPAFDTREGHQAHDSA